MGMNFMDDDKFLPFIIRSKLHRPQIHGVYLHRQNLINQIDQRRERPLTLISAPAGYGKTTLASSWLETTGTPYAWVSLDETDNDLRLFLSYTLTSIQTIFPDFGRQTLTMVNASTLAPIGDLVRSIINEIGRVEESFILALDDIHVIKDESVLELLNQLLRHPPPSMHLMLVGRRDPALPFSRLRANRQMNEIRTQELRFDETEIKTFLTQILGIQVDSTTAAAIANKTEGWVTGLVLAAISMRSQGGLDPALLEPQVTAQSVMEYLFAEVLSQQPSGIIRYLMTTAILDRFCGPLCEALCAQGNDPETLEVRGWDFIAWLKEQNLFLIPLDNEKRWFRYHHLFQIFLLNQLDRSSSQGDINALHAWASEWFAENGLIEEAIKHALAGDNTEAAAKLIANHGFDLINDIEWPRLQRWLKMLPEKFVEQAPELLIIASWLHVIYSRFAELESCLNKAEALCTNRKAEAHVEGHLNALRTFQHNTSVNGERSLACSKRALKKLSQKHLWARMFAFLTQAAAYQMLGNLEMARATIDEAIQEPDLSSGISQSHFYANFCFIYWMDADLTIMMQVAKQSLKLAENYRGFHAAYHGLYFAGIAHYHRNELQAAEEKLATVVNEPYSQHALSFAHSAFALALVHQARGRTDAASQVCESVISYGLDTNHPDMLKIARAFQAELSLRQGRLAETFLWAKQFVAKPFTLMYRFYIPQLTLVRVLLAQNTTDSLEQAADLLKQLYDFVTSTHNKRFQIDVMALQALLDDSRGEATDALKCLTNALQLAEPGGFIRPFLDLGPSMAVLLKRLLKKRIAVDYIKRILAAFEQEGRQTVVPETADQPAASPREHRHPPPLSQLLVDPLTNRELDVLELLAQRLSNKEIADKLFISTVTVKGHLQNIYGKLHVSKRREAVEKAEKIGIL
jgi:LuxR family maltose regulon positive regulatory protein